MSVDLYEKVPDGQVCFFIELPPHGEIQEELEAGGVDKAENSIFLIFELA